VERRVGCNGARVSVAVTLPGEEPSCSLRRSIPWGLAVARGSCLLPNPTRDFPLAAADCCSPGQRTGCSGFPSVAPGRDLPPHEICWGSGGPTQDGSSAQTWARSRPCSALVKSSPVSRPPDLAISVCWKRSLSPSLCFLPAPRYFSWLFSLLCCSKLLVQAQLLGSCLFS